MSQLLPNFTQIPNILIDEWIPKLSAQAGIILLIICRKTYGFHKNRDCISRSQLCERSGLTKKTVIKCTDELIEKGILVQTKFCDSEGDHANSYSLVVKMPEELPCLDKSKKDRVYNLHPPVYAVHSPLVDNLHPQKKPFSINRKGGKERASSAKASSLPPFFLNEIKKRKPGYSKVPEQSWDLVFSDLSKIRSELEIKNLILYSFDHKFWSARILTPKHLFQNLDDIEADMVINKKKSVIEVNNQVNKNRDIIKKISKLFPNRINPNEIEIGSNENYVEFRYGGISPSEHIRVEDRSFYSKVEFQLTKMRLPTGGICP